MSMPNTTGTATGSAAAARVVHRHGLAVHAHAMVLHVPAALAAAQV